jgi:hypothetical protein
VFRAQDTGNAKTRDTICAQNRIEFKKPSEIRRKKKNAPAPQLTGPRTARSIGSNDPDWIRRSGNILSFHVEQCWFPFLRNSTYLPTSLHNECASGAGCGTYEEADTRRSESSLCMFGTTGRLGGAGAIIGGKVRGRDMRFCVQGTGLRQHERTSKVVLGRDVDTATFRAAKSLVLLRVVRQSELPKFQLASNWLFFFFSVTLTPKKFVTQSVVFAISRVRVQNLQYNTTRRLLTTQTCDFATRTRKLGKHNSRIYIFRNSNSQKKFTY